MFYDLPQFKNALNLDWYYQFELLIFFFTNFFVLQNLINVLWLMINNLFFYVPKIMNDYNFEQL